MPITGGSFNLHNKVLPGAYINFVSKGGAVSSGARGIATLPLSLNWGAEDKLIKIDAAEFNKQALPLLGYSATAPELLLVRECLKRAEQLLLYRVNKGGTAASKSIGGIAGGVMVTAKHSGIRGNDIKVAVLNNTAGGFDVLTYMEQQLVDTQTVSAAAELVANDFVQFGTGTLSASAAITLEGGANGTADGLTYAAYLNAVEVENFNAIGYPGTDPAIKSLLVSFTKRLRDDEGKKVVCVLHNQPADHEGIINLKNGVVLADGTTISGDKAVAWVVGASAAAAINESLTNVAYDGAVDTDIKYTRSQYEAAVKAGEFVFYGDSGQARVLSDMNSLVTFGNGKSPDWTSNRVIRVMDGWGNDVARIFGASYTGIATNNDTSRQLFKADLVSLAMQYENIGAISSFDSEDITISQGLGKRDVIVECALTPNDSMEKLYMTVQVA
ncbi:phage tail sheath family protein [Paenibacillus sp. GCM10027627]|uniref:phage tail sheath family protein n=1 Tax=unclassified Paenibacillus TaxID=185978 RepID=UPI00362651F2